MRQFFVDILPNFGADLVAVLFAIGTFFLIGQWRVKAEQQGLMDEITSYMESPSLLQKFTKKISETHPSFRGKETLEQERNEILRRAKKDIWMLLRIGDSFDGYPTEIEHVIIQGGNVRIILLDYEDTVVNPLSSLAARSPDADSQDVKRLKARIVASEDYFRGIEKQAYSKSKRPGKLDIRYSSFMNSIILYLRDPLTDDGEGIVELSPYREWWFTGPSIKLSKSMDYALFEYFRKEFVRYWEKARDPITAPKRVMKDMRR
jgi:hypothetical protein